MNTKKTVLTTTLATILGFAAIGAQAAVVDARDLLNITAGVAVTSNSVVTSFTGSYLAWDINGNSKIAQSEKIALSMGTTGIEIGQAIPLGAIDAPWQFFAITGSSYTTIGITGSTTAGLNMSGWAVTLGDNDIILGTGAWATATGSGHTGATGTFANGIGNFTWCGVCGTAYTLDYRATVPLGSPSGLGGLQYELHLEGMVVANGLGGPDCSWVPVPAAVWLFGSGLLGLLGIARRKAV